MRNGNPGGGAWKATSEAMSLALPPTPFSLPLSPQERPLMGSQEEDGALFHGVGGWGDGGGQRTPRGSASFWGSLPLAFVGLEQ